MRWMVAFALLVASLCGEAASGLREASELRVRDGFGRAAAKLTARFCKV